MRDFNKKLRVLLIDDNANHLRGIKELINLESSYEVVGTTTSANLGINLIKKYHPDIVLLDINMPEKDGLQTIQAIGKLNLSTKVIALSGYDDSDLIYRAMKLGAKGYVLKTMASVKLINAIEEVASGKIYLPTVLATRFFEYFQTSAKEESKAAEGENLLNTLTIRENEVLELLTEGINYKSIAGKLIISETTVKTHVNNIFQKLQVNDRTNAVLYALSHGFKGSKSSAMTTV
ncbi:MAG: response regulator transcription factor [Muribaculaceae bacterium]|nr:response regulator transcription factor [Muribaculaceae bacterium]